MVSPARATRTRKAPTERRQQILDRAAEIAVAHGLESVTLRAVAEPLGVQPSLVHHYFSSSEALVIAAFERAISIERTTLFASEGAPTRRLATMIRRVESGDAIDLARFWLNARNLSRFRPELARAVAEQERLDRDELVAILQAGVAAEEFTCPDPLVACIRIFIAIDGVGAYANDLGDFAHPAFDHFVTDVAAWAIGLAPDVLRVHVEAAE